MILKGWKDVAKHLGCGVRTAQRWERLGMPVRRPNPRKPSSVLAVTEELDAWVSDFATSAEPSTSEISRPRFSYRILIADNDERLLLDLCAKLAAEGYEVRTARDGFEALAAMRDAAPDLVISELRMPKMSGFELLSVVRRRFPSTAVIASSSEFIPTTSPSILCDRYIEKGPNSRFELVAAVRELLELSPLRAQPAKVDTAPAWLPRSTKSYVVLSCLACLRSFSLLTRDASIGKNASTPCTYCGIEVRYHIDDSALPITRDLSSLVKTSLDRITSSHARLRTRPTRDIQKPRPDKS
jgi:CheY-like chemotaxis protein